MPQPADFYINDQGLVTRPGPRSKTDLYYLKNLLGGSEETVAASQTDQVFGGTGDTGDYIAGIMIIPATTSPGAVSIKDGSGSSITVFAGGASSVGDLKPFTVPLGVVSTSGPWKITTGANVSVIVFGNPT